MTDWTRLRPYGEGKRRSFEELCFQLAFQHYGQEGRLTSIDDSGGGDGVEFFLTLPDGTEWGWQAKFFHPDPRMSASRRRQVEESLARSRQVHPRLVRWFLCTPTSFTTGKPGAERAWWERLRESNPDLDMVHWGDSELSEMLARPASAGQRAFFFGEVPLDPEWFRGRLNRQLANLREPFDPALHAFTEADLRVHYLVRDSVWRASLRQTMSTLEEVMAAMRPEWREACAVAGTPAYVPVATALIAAAERALEWVRHVVDHADADLRGHSEALASVFSLVGSARAEFVWTAVGEFKPEMVDSRSVDPDRPTPEPLQILLQPGSRAVQVLQYLHQASETLLDAQRPAMHVIGAAGMGKTHGAAHACHAALAEGRPAVLLLGSRFRAGPSLTAQILDQLDLSCSWDEFTGALEACAVACGTPALLVIDGINESESTALWRNELQGLQESLAGHRHVRLVTTCRPSYISAIWGDTPADAIEARGFQTESLPLVADRYFRRYGLVVDMTLTPLGQFRHPLYLKIFCESETRGGGAEKQVFLGAQTLYTVFERYLARTSRSLCERLDQRPRDRFLEESLAPLCDVLWTTGRRTLPLEDAMRMLDGSGGAGWRGSLTRALIDEGVLHADLATDAGEGLGFTYDLLGGYLIARWLLASGVHRLEDMVRPGPLQRRLSSPVLEERHPLHEDILPGLAAAAPERTGRHLFQVAQDAVLWNAGLHALFEMDPQWVTDREVVQVASYFSEARNRGPLLALAMSTALSPKHPLNLRLWDELLKHLRMQERDLAWSVHVEQALAFWEWLAAETERVCRSEAPPSLHVAEKLELAVLGLRWVLACTVPGLRDRATRALYWYGRRYPDRFANFAVDALSFNDPYVPERCLAACYGVAMAFRADPAAAGYRQEVLPRLAERLYFVMFAPHAPRSTTHALLRDSAAGIIELAALTTPGLFGPDQLRRASHPFPPGSGSADPGWWGSADDHDRGRYHDGNDPLRADFAARIVRGLVRSSPSFDGDHPDSSDVMGKVRWRMYELGYELDAFGERDVRTETVALMAPATEPRPYVERFGLKYARIAYLELHGSRSDQDLLPHLHEPVHRPAEVDLDPSFPDPPRDVRIVTEKLLPDPPATFAQGGSSPDMGKWLVVPAIAGEDGPWVLLDAELAEINPATGHGALVTIRSALSDAGQASALARHLAGLARGEQGLPSASEDRHTYAGEAPWRGTFPANQPEVATLQHRRTGAIRSFRILLPVRHNRWESHHSEITCSYGAAILDRRIAERFGLWMRLPSWDLHEPDGRRATSVVLHRSDTAVHSMTWIRKDILDRWLRQERQAIVWMARGEMKRSARPLSPAARHEPSPSQLRFSTVYRLLGDTVTREA